MTATLGDILSAADCGADGFEPPALPPWPLNYFPPRAFRVAGYDYSGCEDSVTSIEERCVEVALPKGELCMRVSLRAVGLLALSCELRGCEL